MASSPLSSPLPFPQSNPLPHCSTSTFVSRCPELDLSVTSSPSGTPGKNPPLGKRDQLGVTSCSSANAGRKKQAKTQVCFASPVATQESDFAANTLPHHQNRNHHRAPRQHLSEPNLEEMTLNSTLVLKKELQLLQGAEFNPQKAIKETLQKSERTKNLINTRAADVVNVSRSQLLYNSLVNVDIQKDEVISQAVRERLLIGPPPCCRSKNDTDAPSHLIFMTSALIRQQPFSPEEETAKSSLCPLPPSSHSAFDLYTHQKCHEVVS